MCPFHQYYSFFWNVSVIRSNLYLPQSTTTSTCCWVSEDPFAICQIFRPKFKIHISNIFSYHPSNLQVRQTHSLPSLITHNQQLQQQLLTYQFIILKTVIELLKLAVGSGFTWPETVYWNPNKSIRILENLLEYVKIFE